MQNHFSIEHENQIINITAHMIDGQRIFRLVHKGKPIIITRAVNTSGQKFWTSIPAGFKQATEIGALIENHHSKI